MRSIRSSERIRKQARRCCSSIVSPLISPISTRTERPLRPRLFAGRIAAAKATHRPSDHPRISGALALATQQRRDLGQSLHPALRSHGLLARRPENGACGHHRRQTFLTEKNHAILDDCLLPENQQTLVIQVAPYAPSFFPAIPTTSR